MLVVSDDGTVGASGRYKIYKEGPGNRVGYDGHGRRVWLKKGRQTNFYFYVSAGVLRYCNGQEAEFKSEYHTIAGQLFARRDYGDGGSEVDHCDYSNADQDGRWGWDPVNMESSEPL